jgi:hypothetical protein
LRPSAKNTQQRGHYNSPNSRAERTPTAPEDQAGNDPEQDRIHITTSRLFALRLLGRTKRLAIARRQTAVRRHAEAVATPAAAELVTRLLMTAFAFFAHEKSGVRFSCNLADHLV